MTLEVAAVRDEHGDGTAFPVVEFADVVADRVPPASIDRIRRRGCVVLRGTFERSQAEAWDEQIAGYLAANSFDAVFADRYPEAAATGSRIWGVYWSVAQVEARQHANATTARRFLNSIWHHDVGGRSWFDPDRDIGYPDRLRRRAPGVTAKGLPPHSDSASSGGWRTDENASVFREVLSGRFDDYDPWDASHRTTVEAVSAAPASVFRSFQGWTALSEMHPADGVLHVIPIPTAAAYLLVRGIAGELGRHGNRPEEAPRRFRADDVLLPALTPIPIVEPGDTVWWHGDVVHSVDAAANDTRSGNVMYIGVAPRCPRNDAYAPSMLERFERGQSPLDFPDEHFECDFVGRATIDDLNAEGRDHFGLDRVDAPDPMT